MKRCLLMLIGLVIGSSFLSPAYASYYQGYVVSVMADGGKILVVLANGFGQSTCSNPKFYLDPNAAYDRAMLSLAISAKLTEKLVYVSGNDNCQSEWPYSNAQQLNAIDLKG